MTGLFDKALAQEKYNDWRLKSIGKDEYDRMQKSSLVLWIESYFNQKNAQERFLNLLNQQKLLNSDDLYTQLVDVLSYWNAFERKQDDDLELKDERILLHEGANKNILLKSFGETKKISLNRPLDEQEARKMMGNNFFGVEEWRKLGKVFTPEELAQIPLFPWGEDILHTDSPFSYVSNGKSFRKPIKEDHFAFLGLVGCVNGPLTIQEWQRSNLSPQFQKQHVSYYLYQNISEQEKKSHYDGEGFFSKNTLQFCWYLMPLNPGKQICTRDPLTRKEPLPGREYYYVRSFEKEYLSSFYSGYRRAYAIEEFTKWQLYKHNHGGQSPKQKIPVSICSERTYQDYKCLDGHTIAEVAVTPQGGIKIRDCMDADTYTYALVAKQPSEYPKFYDSFQLRPKLATS